MSSRTLITELIGHDNALENTGLLLMHDSPVFKQIPDTLNLSGLTVRVRRTPTELELRHALWDAKSTPLVALIPETLAMNMPADLLRTAGRQRVHTYSQDEVLGIMLGTRVIGIDERYLFELGRLHLDRVRGALDQKTTPTVVDSDMLQRTLLEVLDEVADLRLLEPAQILARWSQRPPSWDGHIGEFARAVLLQDRSTIGTVLAWSLDEPSTRPREIIIFGAVLAVDADVPDHTWGPLLELREGKPHDHPDVRDLRQTLGRFATEAISFLGAATRELLNEADTAARRALTPAQHRTSTLLPLAFQELAHQLAHRLAQGEVVSDADLGILRAHAFASTSQDEIDQLTDLARLSRYLASPKPSELKVGVLAHRYLTDGAYADLVVQHVQRRIGVVVKHQAATESVISRVRERRNQENRAFAELLQADYAGALHDQGVIPLHLLGQRSLQPMWSTHSDTKIYLVVLDGCSVPVFFDLLEQLNTGPMPIALELRPDNAPNLAPGFAPLPTITSHARGALFAGRIPGDRFANETTYREVEERKTDPARFRRNGNLNGKSRQLFLKGDLADNGLALVEALRGETEVVAAVFNAVDDAIGSKGTGNSWSIRATDIKGLIPSLRDALAARRKVIVTADHGHTPFVALDHRVGAGSTPRFARLDAGDAVPEGFIEIDCADLAGEEGRFAFAWKVGVYRGQQPQVGFHGGCSLEEVVVPVAWLTGSDGVPPDRPTWYGYDESSPARPAMASLSKPSHRSFAAPAQAQPAKPASTRAPNDAPQLTLIGSDAIETYAARAELVGVPAPIRDAFPNDALAVLVLLMENDVVRSAEIGRALGRAPHRIDGWLTKLNRQLTPHGARLVSEKLPDGAQQWRYVGAREA